MSAAPPPSTGSSDPTPEEATSRLSAYERAADRRRRLLDAGLEEFGTVGYAAATVSAITSRARLSKRSFYENFTDREDMLRAVYDEIVAAGRDALLSAIPKDDPGSLDVMNAVRAYVGHLTRDPRRTRVQTVEVVGVSAALEVHRREVIHDFAGIIAGRFRTLPRSQCLPDDMVFGLAVALTGAVNELLVEWVLTPPDERPDGEWLIDVVAAVVVPTMTGTSA